MSDASLEDWRLARNALAVEVRRLTRLVHSVSRPEAHAVGVWNARDVAVHLSHAWTALPALARGEAASPLGDVGQLGAFTTTLVAGDAEHDLRAVAQRIDTAAEGFLQLTASRAPDETGPWLVEGVQVSLLTFACHLLNETMVHAWDIAHSQRVRWRIDPAHAALVMRRFVFPALGNLDPRAMVDQEKAAHFSACYELRIRRGDRVYVVFDDGAVHMSASAPRAVDCHISAEPAALFLVLWGRVSQWPATLTGRLLAWGRKPWLGPRLRTVLKNP